MLSQGEDAVRGGMKSIDREVKSRGMRERVFTRRTQAGTKFDRREEIFLSIAAEAYEQELDLPLFPK